jgi:hypothetical protein
VARIQPDVLELLDVKLPLDLLLLLLLLPGSDDRAVDVRRTNGKRIPG